MVGLLFNEILRGTWVKQEPPKPPLLIIYIKWKYEFLLLVFVGVHLTTNSC